MIFVIHVLLEIINAKDVERACAQAALRKMKNIAKIANVNKTRKGNPDW